MAIRACHTPHLWTADELSALRGELPPPPRLGPERGLRLLVVEDTRLVREALRTRLERAGYVVEAVADGESALRALSRRRFDLLILDVYLPLCDGFDVLQALRADPASAGLPVLAISGSCSRPDEFRRLREAGVHSFLDKRDLKRALLPRVRELLNAAVSAA